MKHVRTPDTLGRMPNKPKTQHRSVRISNEDWSDLETVADTQDTDRAKVINQLVRWYLRRSGVKLPDRPQHR